MLTIKLTAAITRGSVPSWRSRWPSPFRFHSNPNPESLVHTFNCSLDLALTYSMRRPALARQCALDAVLAAYAMRNPALIDRANDVLAAIGGGK